MRAIQKDSHILEGSLYRYVFVGKGAQFRVYSVYTLDDRPTGRVVKVPLDFTETKQAIFEPLRLLNVDITDDVLDEMADRRTREVMGFMYDVPSLLQGVRAKDQMFMKRLGNMKMLRTIVPTHNDDDAYRLPMLFTQDYVMTLDEYLQKFRLASNPYARKLDYESAMKLRSVVDQMVQLNFMIWEYGIFEFVFKPENFGIKQKQSGELELIWIDLAEHITDYDKAQEIMKEKRWLHPLMTHKIDYQFMPLILHEYYQDACAKAFTGDNLRRLWRRKSIKAEKKAARQLRIREFFETDEKRKVSHWIARYNVANSLNYGFTDRVIDDMQIPIGDIELLIADRQAVMTGRNFAEEHLERQTFESKLAVRTIPITAPSQFLSQKERF